MSVSCCLKKLPEKHTQIMTALKVVVILLLCSTVSLAKDGNRTDCLIKCPAVDCALPDCEEGYNISKEVCVPDSYSCCPRCVKDTEVTTTDDLRRDECLRQCPLVLCQKPICNEGYKISSEICVPDSYTCCPRCVRDTYVAIPYDDERRTECLKQCPLVRCARLVCKNGFKIDTERCVPYSYSCCPRCVKDTDVTIPYEDERRTECLKQCPLVRCARPVCKKGFKIDTERCVPYSYSCCPRCVKDTDVSIPYDDVRRTECLKQCPLVRCARPVCRKGFKIDTERCVPYSYSCCPGCVKDTDSIDGDIRRTECLNKCSEVSCLEEMCPDGTTRNNEICVPDSYSCCPTCIPQSE